ncbi:hypothetical protein [Rhizobium mongolense]|uniref:Uncharacterized protein n=1 Tax=Rhizobium mongolense TaxID=57676 RepID=A0A7W6RRM6_9HYPH|nr:hypothetical protein [Rhizobium mongolense]
MELDANDRLKVGSPDAHLDALLQVFGHVTHRSRRQHAVFDADLIAVRNVLGPSVPIFKSNSS